MSPIKLLVVAIAAGALVAGATAGAEPKPYAGGTTAAPQPVPAGEFRQVIYDVEILGAADEVLEERHCEWTEPQDDDKPCLAFANDPQDAYRAIKDAGGAGARVAVQVPELEIDTVTRISERDNGTWLFRTTGQVDGKAQQRGYVCSSDGRTCTPWAAASKRGSKRAIKAASAKLRRQTR